MIGNAIAPCKVPGTEAHASQYASAALASAISHVDTVGAIEQCEGLAHVTAGEAERIEHGKLAFDLRFKSSRAIVSRCSVIGSSAWARRSRASSRPPIEAVKIEPS